MRLRRGTRQAASSRSRQPTSSSASRVRRAQLNVESVACRGIIRHADRRHATQPWTAARAARRPPGRGLQLERQLLRPLQRRRGRVLEPPHAPWGYSSRARSTLASLLDRHSGASEGLSRRQHEQRTRDPWRKLGRTLLPERADHLHVVRDAESARGPPVGTHVEGRPTDSFGARIDVCAIVAGHAPMQLGPE